MKHLRRLLACAAALIAPSLGAQTVAFTVTSTGAAFANPTLADYAAGYVNNTTPITYRVQLSSGSAGRTYTTTVMVQATATTFGTKVLSDLQAGTGATYQAMTSGSTWVTLASHVLTTTSQQATGSIYVRSLLNWGDNAASYTVPLRFQISVVRQ